jgi:hypothetical protein
MCVSQARASPISGFDPDEFSLKSSLVHCFGNVAQEEKYTTPMERSSAQFDLAELQPIRRQNDHGVGVQNTAVAEQSHSSDSIYDEPHGSPQQLKSADGGRDAWQVLIAGFMFEALLWGEK